MRRPDRRVRCAYPFRIAADLMFHCRGRNKTPRGSQSRQVALHSICYRWSAMRPHRTRPRVEAARARGRYLTLREDAGQISMVECAAPRTGRREIRRLRALNDDKRTCGLEMQSAPVKRKSSSTLCGLPFCGSALSNAATLVEGTCQTQRQ